MKHAYDIMTYKKPLRLLSAFLLAFALAGCADLSVNNENAPNREVAVQSAEDVKSVLAGGYATWWDGVYEDYQPAVHLDGWADAMTTTNAFAGFWDTTNEPRIQFNNSPSYADKDIVMIPWENLNSAVSSANDVINSIENEDRAIVVEGEDQTQMVLSAAYFLRGISRGYLANIFDQAYIVPAEYNAETDPRPELVPQLDVLTAAISDLDRSIAISNENSFTTEEFLPDMDYDSEQFSRLANSWAARFIVSNSRTASENSNVDWSRIKEYATNGIQEGFILQMDGTNWGNVYTEISGLFWYFRIDNRILNLMSEAYPKKYPEAQAGTALARISTQDTTGAAYVTQDARLKTDFVYTDDMSYFRISRGPRLQSTYFYNRWGDQQWNVQPFGAGPEPVMLAAENDLLLAEAELELGNLAAAIEIVNSGTRVERGELEPLSASASEEDVYNAIFYERDVELMRSGTGLAFFDLRRRNGMQEGTPLHLPVPADELTTIEAPVYTFGGAANAGQPGTADGSNSWTMDGNNPPGMPQ